ncbi:hypothetical protein SOVF_161260, partial [Spinacia oleracea]
MNDHEAH